MGWGTTECLSKVFGAWSRMQRKVWFVYYFGKYLGFSELGFVARGVSISLMVWGLPGKQCAPLFFT